MSLPRVLVNMLWCVPGRVGGSEEYLVRQVLGLAEQAIDCVGEQALVRVMIKTKVMTPSEIAEEDKRE